MLPSIRQEKQLLRRQMLAYRREHGASLQEEMRVSLAQRLSTLLPSPPLVLAGYWPFPEEADVKPSLLTLHEAGYLVCLPVVVAPATPLEFRRWVPEITLTPNGRMQILEPPPSSPIHQPDSLLVPLAAFDRRGYRLGFGGGFYDRTLARLRQHKDVLAIGVAFSFQEVHQVPTEPTDEPLDWIITEKELIRKP